jgi:hypothetical protein
MGGMVDGLFRVRDEILRLRRERELLLASREEETRDRRAAVSRMLARFSRDLAGAADRGRIRRMDFLTDLRRGILGLLDGLEADCGGAREALVRLAGARSSAPCSVASSLAPGSARAPSGPSKAETREDSAPRVRLSRNRATEGAAALARRPPKGKAEAQPRTAKSTQQQPGRRRGMARRRPRS